jgi:acyl-CoA synthetase (NDP forming)
VAVDVLPQDQALQRLRAVGIVPPSSALVSDPGAAEAAARELPAGDLVLKAGGLLHKSDEGGVVLGLASPEAVGAAAERLLQRLGPAAAPFVVQEQVEGLEVLVGLRRVPSLGTAVVVGAGGILTETLRDIAWELAPLDAEQARSMVDGLRIRPLLDGVRGTVRRDVDALVDLVVAVSELANVHDDVLELDLNPVMVGPVGAGVRAVDVRMLVDRSLPPVDARPVRDLRRLLRPRHVAVVGVSDDPRKVGARLFSHLVRHGFPGQLTPVHPAGGEVAGHPRAISLLDLDDVPDLVCVAVPASQVVQIARDAAAIGAGAVLVHSSDFAEIGDDGHRLQQEVADVLAPSGVLLAGPNDMGIVAPHQRLAASISGALGRIDLLAGSTALVSSSGALGSCLATRLLDRGVGLSHWIHVGNEADLTMADYLRWLVDDPDTRAVGLLVEDLKDGPSFVASVRALVAARKPVFAYHMVRSADGAAAAQSHTGAMVGPFELREAVLRAGGVVSTPSLQTLEDALRLASRHGLPAGPRLAALTFSGGACTIIADAAEELGVALPELDEATQEAIRAHVPAFAAVRNPLDVSYQLISTPERFRAALRALVAGGSFDAALVQFTTNADPGATRIAEGAVSLLEEVDVPIYLARYGGEQLAPDALAHYAAAGIPLLDAPDRAMQAIAALIQARAAIDRFAGRSDT